MELVALGIIAAAALFGIAVLSGIVKFRKFPASLFASRIDRTVGSVKLTNSGSPRNAIDVHVLGTAKPPDWIGLTIKNDEYADDSPLQPVTLSVAGARRLAALLVEATN